MNVIHGNSLEVLKSLPSDHFHCVVTSPPYWKLRDYGVDGQLGLEATPDEYIANQVAVFREVRRVLRADGTCWVNIGDSYASGGNGGGGSFMEQRKNGSWGSQSKTCGWRSAPSGYKHKDMIGIPWMLAFALRADGWYLRSEVIWSKKSPMPESVKDRPTKAHEQIFLLTKSPKYFYDVIGSQEECTGNAHSRGRGVNIKAKQAGQITGARVKQNEDFSKHLTGITTKRNMRSVWSIASYPLKQAHFAAFPPELVRKCLSAGTSEHGCCDYCGKPYKRIVSKIRIPTRPGTNSKLKHCSNWAKSSALRDVAHDAISHNTPSAHPKTTKHDAMAESGSTPFKPTEFGNRDPQRHVTETKTIGWKPSCDCVHSGSVACRVLDPYHGAGTTMKVCERLGLEYTGIELNEDYIRMSMERPPVKFPHETCKAKSQGKRSIKVEMQLEFNF